MNTSLRGNRKNNSSEKQNTRSEEYGVELYVRQYVYEIMECNCVTLISFCHFCFCQS